MSAAAQAPMSANVLAHPDPGVTRVIDRSRWSMPLRVEVTPRSPDHAPGLDTAIDRALSVPTVAPTIDAATIDVVLAERRNATGAGRPSSGSRGIRLKLRRNEMHLRYEARF
jgi:hypothetical protein